MIVLCNAVPMGTPPWGDDAGVEGDGGALACPLHQAKLCLGEAQPWHLAVGQTCNTRGLEELRSPHKLPGYLCLRRALV
jgi:hypothetical protein